MCIRDRRHIVEVADVAHSLNLLQVGHVVNVIEHEVVLQSNVESLHFLGFVSELGDSSVNAVLRLHEGVILGLDLIDDSGSANSLVVCFPVDLLKKLVRSYWGAFLFNIEHLPFLCCCRRAYCRSQGWTKAKSGSLLMHQC